MGLGAAQFLGRHDLVGDGLHHVRAGDEHVGRIADHEDEIGHGRRIDGAPAQGPMTTLICGTTPEAMMLRWKTSA